jgi:hypothetical protein
MILHFGQILFTDALTFIETLLLVQKLPAKARFLFLPFPIAERLPHHADRKSFGPIRNSTPIQVIGRQFDGHPVTGKNFNKMHPHFTGDMGQNLMLVIEFHLEHRVRQGLENRALDFYGFFLGH